MVFIGSDRASQAAVRLQNRVYRFKMRRRVKALSAEGRFSALALSILPVFVFGAMNLLAPGFYADVWDEPVVTKVLGYAGAFMMTGNFIMYRMVNFKI